MEKIKRNIVPIEKIIPVSKGSLVKVCIKILSIGAINEPDMTPKEEIDMRDNTLTLSIKTISVQTYLKITLNALIYAHSICFQG